jgi:hypothetical protein
MLTEAELHDFDVFTKAIGRRVAAFPQGFEHCTLQAAAAGTQPIFCLLRVGGADSRPSEVLDYGKVQLRSTSFTAHANSRQKQTKQQCVINAQNNFNRTMDRINQSTPWPSMAFGTLTGMVGGAIFGCLRSPAACVETWGLSAAPSIIKGGTAGGAAGTALWFAFQEASMDVAEDRYLHDIESCNSLPD